jgi:hypothetical protein
MQWEERKKGKGRKGKGRKGMVEGKSRKLNIK